MAELVDALVSNTNAARRTGSSPVLGTGTAIRKENNPSLFFIYLLVSKKIRTFAALLALPVAYGLRLCADSTYMIKAFIGALFLTSWNFASLTPYFINA